MHSLPILPCVCVWVCVCVCKWDGQDESLKLKWSQNKRNREMRVLSPALGDNAWYGGQGEICEREGWQLRRDGVVAGVTATRRRHSFANYWPWKMTIVSIKNSRTHKVFHASICLNCQGKSHESTYGKFPWPPLKALVSPHTSTYLRIRRDNLLLTTKFDDLLDELCRLFECTLIGQLLDELNDDQMKRGLTIIVTKELSNKETANVKRKARADNMR